MISVIVPVYKVEDYLDRCVKSIVNQTYHNLEVILVDDGSPDNCPIMCDDWADKDRRIRVIHKKNGGLSDARNAGLAIATGEYISFVDSDDWIANEMLERLLETIKQDGSDIAVCSVKMVWEDETPDKMLTDHNACVLSVNEAQSELLKERKLKQPVWYKLYRRAMIENIQFEKGKIHEDAFWSYQVIGKAQKVSIIDYVGYFYWQRNGSIMGEDYSIKRLDALEAYCRRYEYMIRFFPELSSEALCSIWMSSMYYGQMALKYLNKDEQMQVFHRLKKIQKQYPIHIIDYAAMKVSHKIWIILSKVSQPMACIFRNLFGVGL